MVPPRHIFEDTVDVFVTLEDEYCTDGFCYFVEVTTPQFLSTLIKKKKMEFLSPKYPFIIVSKLTDDTVRAAIESFINPQDELYWLKLYNLIDQLNIEEIDEILYRKKRESIELESEVDAELEDESATND